MSNPYQPPSVPQSPPPASPLAEELRGIATAQRYLMLSILALILCYVMAFVTAFFMPRMIGLFAMGVGVAMLASAICGFMLAYKIDGPVMAVIFGLCTLIPCAGFICLVMINQRATAKLQDYRISVGLLGPDMDGLEDRIRQIQSEAQYEQWRNQR
jgi:hypothetical protein